MKKRPETFEDCRQAVGDLNNLLYTEENPYPLELNDTCTGVWVVTFNGHCLFSSENDYLKEFEDEEGVVIGYEGYDERLRREIGKLVVGISRAAWMAGIPMEGIALEEE